MLNDIGARIEQLHAHRAHIRKLGLLGQVGEPSALLHDDVVVDEQKHLAVGVLRPQVVERGHVELHPLENIEASSVLVDLVHQLLHFPAVHLVGPVVHDDDLVGHGGVLLDRVHAARQHLRIVLARDDDADKPRIGGIHAVPSGQRFFDQVAVPQFHPVAPVEEDLRHMSDREFVPLLFPPLGVAAVRLRQFQAQRPVDPRPDRAVVLVVARPLLVQAVLAKRRRALVIGRLPLPGVDQREGR